MKIEHISVSRKKLFRDCAVAYRFRYHYKTPRPGPEPEYFVFGKIVHKCAEIYVQQGGQRMIGEIAQEVMRGKIQLDEYTEVAPTLSPEYSKKLQKHLRSIQKFTNQIGFDGYTEWEFKYDLDPPHKMFLVGFVDRLILRDDKAYVIDYKTTKKSKWRTNRSNVTRDLQLRTYARMVQKAFNLKPANIKAALYFLEGEELVAATFSKESLDAVETELKEEFEIIRDADPDHVWGNVGPRCSYCDYCTICPFYKAASSKALAWDGDMTKIPK
jgi:CRISPR/Cas system-associated exonuclease Cas4 (RecB family)